MKINRLTICNISSYEGESSFDFTVSDSSKNIILVGGKNGAGKSSLFLAMKLALYGPLAFNYQGVNPKYISRIKELINHNTYTKSEVKAYAELEISMFEEREYVNYKINRVWELVNKKLQETVYVYKEGDLLNSEQLIFFQEYLNTILPVNLFDLYFFDGEKIEEMFEGVKYKNFVKKSLLTLYSVDVFEVLRKYFDNYVGRTKGDEELEKAQEEFRNIVDILENKDTEVNFIVEEMKNIQNSIDNAESRLKDIEEAFHRAGGLTEKEKEHISHELLRFEKVKNENNMKVKSFAEDLLPFIICGDYADSIRIQLDCELEVKRYQMVKNEITPEFTKGILFDSIVESNNDNKLIEDINEFSDIVYRKIAEQLRPQNSADAKIVHDLSSEQRDRVITTINRVSDFKKNEVLTNIKTKQNALNKTIALNKKLRKSLNETDVISFMKEINEKENNIAELKRNHTYKEELYEKCKDDILLLEQEKVKIKGTLKSKTQQNNIYDLSEKLSHVMNTMVQEVSRSKFNELEEAFLIIFKKIMRKDNIVDYIKIDDDFKLNLYQEQSYRMSEISMLISNLGYEKMVDRIGGKGIKVLLKCFSVDNHNDLKAKIEKNEEEIIPLYKKIGLGQLSKGEKQIFTLSLYWAMIKIANHEIPFIIDTPYARIDAQHREHITKEFFTTISKQVIILSTDEEINEHYYEVMKSSIAHEYLLVNDKDENKTTVKEGYFFKGEDNDI